MTAAFIEEMNQQLQAERAAIIEALMTTNAAFKEKMAAREGTGDTIDEATDVMDRQLMEAMGSKDSARLQAIDFALVRIRQGKYGLCAKCGKDIPEDRLRALPQALLCVDCKSQEERRAR
jgi:RNA polymerase-binding protein DksA